MTNYNKPVSYAGSNGNFWIYSMPKPTLVTLQSYTSQNSLREMSPQTQLLSSTGILLNTQNCYIYSKYFMLLPRSKGKTFTNILTNHVVIPSIKNILTFSELKTFHPTNPTTTKNLTADKQEILNNVSEPVVIISITKLQNKTRTDKRTV